VYVHVCTEKVVREYCQDSSHTSTFNNQRSKSNGVQVTYTVDWAGDTSVHDREVNESNYFPAESRIVADEAERQRRKQNRRLSTAIKSFFHLFADFLRERINQHQTVHNPASPATAGIAAMTKACKNRRILAKVFAQIDRLH